MSLKLTKSIVMIGMMGAGKSAIGRALAEVLAVDFVDSDDEIEAAANLKISEIFEKYGEAEFRNKEAQVIARLLDETPKILATGGGAFLTDSTRKLINEQATSVWLNTDLEIAWLRVKDKTHRPLLQTENPKQVLTDMYNARRETYAKAHLQIDITSNCSIDVTRDLVLEALKSNKFVEEQK